MGKNLTEEQKQMAIERMHVALVSGVNIFNPAWYSKLTKTAEGQRLVILDVLRRFHGEDENNTSAMTRLLGVLEGICGKTDATILFLHHATKAAILAGMGDLQQASRGSSVLTDNTRWQAYLTAMTAAEAKKYHIPEGDRKKYVRFGIAKQNYDRPFDDIWLEKNYSKGIMERAYLQEIQEVKKNEKTW
jgi:RecA-family ATPase